MKYLIYFTVIFGFLTSCFDRHQYENSNIETIVINNRKIKNVEKIDDIVDSIKFIFLETSPNSLISNFVSKIEIKNNRLFVIKSGLNSSITIFDVNNGKFISKIIPTGSGPGEFSHLGNVYINSISEKIEVFAGFEQKILEYDFNGSFVEEKPFAIPFSNKIILDGGEKIHATQVPTSITLHTLKDFEVFSLDSKNAFKKGIKLLNVKGQIRLVSDYSFFTYLDSVRYLRPFSDTIFHVSHDRIIPRYIYEFTAGYPKKNFWETVPVGSVIDEIYENYKIPVVSPYFTESENYLVGPFKSNDGYSYHYIYDKKSKKTKSAFSRLWYGKWDIPLPPILHVFENGLFFLITPNECKKLVEEHPKSSLLPIEFVEKVRQLGPTDNPILMIVKLK